MVNGGINCFHKVFEALLREMVIRVHRKLWRDKFGFTILQKQSSLIFNYELLGVGILYDLIEKTNCIHFPYKI